VNAIPTAPLTEAQLRRRLAPPDGPVRVVIDTDAHNEIDDQFALAWALLSQDRLQIEGIYAAPYSFRHHREELLRAFDLLESGKRPEGSDRALWDKYAAWVQGLQAVGTHPADLSFPGPAEGMENSYQEILRVQEKLGLTPDWPVCRGAERYMSARADAVRTEATDRLIESALEGEADDPLYVVAIGCPTNVASALALEPRIAERVVVLWTSAYPSWVDWANEPSLNLIQDVPASQVLFESGVPLVYLPGFYIGEQLKISLPEVERWVRGRGAIGDYLHWLYTHNPIHAQRGITGHFGRTWVIWDLINVAWLLEPAWVPSKLVPAPRLRADTTWERGALGHLMREAIAIDRDAIFRDFLGKLARAADGGDA